MWGGESEAHTAPFLAFLRQLEVRSPAPRQKNGRHRFSVHFPNRKKRPKYRHGESSTWLAYGNGDKFKNPSYIHRACNHHFCVLSLKMNRQQRILRYLTNTSSMSKTKNKTKQIEKRTKRKYKQYKEMEK